MIKVSFFIAVLLIPLSLALFTLPAGAQDPSRETESGVDEAATPYARAHEIDEMLSKYFKPGEPGASVIVSQRGAVLFRKAYGLANTETNVLLQPKFPLRTGSVTKQFTAAAIMLLAEQGKLSLADELEKYFPEYPLPGLHVTIENFLTHTSGIRNYTELPQFGVLLTQDVSPDDAIEFSRMYHCSFNRAIAFHTATPIIFCSGESLKRCPASATRTLCSSRFFSRCKCTVRRLKPLRVLLLLSLATRK